MLVRGPHGCPSPLNNVLRDKIPSVPLFWRLFVHSVLREPLPQLEHEPVKNALNAFIRQTEGANRGNLFCGEAVPMVQPENSAIAFIGRRRRGDSIAALPRSRASGYRAEFASGRRKLKTQWFQFRSGQPLLCRVGTCESNRGPSW